MSANGNQVFIRFECGSEDRWSEAMGPYPWVQATYDVIRVGEDGEQEIAVFRDGVWKTRDGQWWSDFVIGPWTDKKETTT